MKWKTRCSRLTVVMVLLAAGWGGLAQAAGDEPTEADSREEVGRYYLLEAPEGADFAGWREGLRRAGLPLWHLFPPAGGILAAPEGDLGLLRLAAPAGTTIHEQSPEGEARHRLLATDAGRALWHAHRRIGTLAEDDGEAPNPGRPLDRDALVPPIKREAPERAGCSATELKRTTSEYLLGRVSLNLILPESNGAIDASKEDWDSSRENSVVAGVVQGMNDLILYYGGTSLAAALQPSFTYHTYFGRTATSARTSYEPISRNADPSNDPGAGEGLWVREILGNLGYSGALSKWDMGYEFNGDTRLADGTDWAFTIFVADSLNDADGQFGDGYFGYAWLSGPYVVMTYDNDGWGIGQMNVVSRHETCHIFHALDEYTSSLCTCTQVSGYVNYPNQNCNNSCIINQNCVMNEWFRQSGICAYTAGQVGWGDADSDRIPDPVDIAPDTALNAYGATYSGHLLPTGTSGVVARSSQSVWGYQCDRNILTIAGTDWRLKLGSWAPALPQDGIFDGPVEAFYFNASVGPGTYTYEARAVDTLGQNDASPALVSVQVLGLPGVPDGTGTGSAMRSSKLDPAAGSIQILWDQATCAPPGNHLVSGYGSGLPAFPGGLYAPSLPGVYCSLGTTGTVVIPMPFDPAVDPTRFIWWVMVPDGGASQPWVEGSWGRDSALLERSGPGPWGASGLCATSDKDVGVTCGH